MPKICVPGGGPRRGGEGGGTIYATHWGSGKNCSEEWHATRGREGNAHSEQQGQKSLPAHVSRHRQSFVWRGGGTAN